MHKIKPKQSIMFGNQPLLSPPHNQVTVMTHSLHTHIYRRHRHRS